MLNFLSRLFVGSSSKGRATVTLVNEQNDAVKDIVCQLVQVQSTIAEGIAPGFQRTHKPFFFGYVSGLSYGFSGQMGLDPAGNDAALAGVRALTELTSSRPEAVFEDLSVLERNSHFKRGRDAGFEDAYSFKERKSALGLVRGVTG